MNPNRRTNVWPLCGSNVKRRMPPIYPRREAETRLISTNAAKLRNCPREIVKEPHGVLFAVWNYSKAKEIFKGKDNPKVTLKL